MGEYRTPHLKKLKNILRRVLRSFCNPIKDDVIDGKGDGTDRKMATSNLY